MLREINISAQNNAGARQFSQSALTVSNMPEPTRLLTELDRSRQADTDLRKAGVDSAGPGPLDNFQINLLA